MTFTNAKIVSRNTDTSAYHSQQHKRGQPGFVMSRSELTTFAACPSKWIRGWRSEDTESTEWGSLIDCLVLQPDTFKADFAIKPETYRSDEGEKPWNGNSKVCKQWLADHEGKSIISAKERIGADAAVSRLVDDDEINDFLQASDKQVMATAGWTDKETGLVVPLKILVDLVPWEDHERFGKDLGDLKTTRDASLRPYNKDVFHHGYHVQAALYLDVYCAATGEDRVGFRHVVSENSSPYEPGLRYISNEYVELGRVTYKSQLAFYCRCLAEQRWPGYDDLETLERRLCGRWSVCDVEPWMVQI